MRTIDHLLDDAADELRRLGREFLTRLAFEQAARIVDDLNFIVVQRETMDEGEKRALLHQIKCRWGLRGD